MSRSKLLRQAAATVFIMALLFLVGSWIFFGPSQTDEISSIVAAIVGLVSALFWVLNNNFLAAGSIARPDQLDMAARELAETVAVQWEREAMQRGLRDGEPAQIRWVTSPHVDQAPRPGRGGANLSTYEGAILDLFESSRFHRLVVIAPGAAGKSVFALFFTLSRLATRKRSDPVPVMLSLSSWNPRNEDFVTWAEHKIIETYPFLNNSMVYGSKTARKLVETKRVTLVLDGLDEVSEPVRAQAVEFIARALPPSFPFILTCRAEAYSHIAATLRRLQAVVEVRLQPLAPADVINYLYGTEVLPDERRSSGGAPKPWWRRLLAAGAHETGSTGRQAQRVLEEALESPHWRPVFAAIRRPEPGPLKEVLSVPLYTALVRRIHHDHEDLAGFVREMADREADAIKQYLIDGLLDKLDNPTGNRGAGPRASKTGRPGPQRRWLSFLAVRLTSELRSNIEWWRLHTLLNPWQWAVVSGLLTSIVYLMTSNFPEGLKRGTAIGMALAIVIGLTRGILAGPRAGLQVGLCTAVSVQIVSLLVLDPFHAFFLGLELGAALGVAVGMMRLLQRSVPSALLVSFVAGVAAAVATGTQDAILLGPTRGALRFVTTILGMGLSVAFGGLLSMWLRIGQPPKQPASLNAMLAKRERRLLPYLAVGLVGGLAIGLGGGLVGALRYWIASGPDQAVRYGAVIGLTYGLTAGLAVGLTGGYMRWFSEPSTETVAVTPLSTLVYGRLVAIAYLLLPTTAAVGVSFLVTSVLSRYIGPLGLTPGLVSSLSPLNGAALGASIGLVLACCFTSWPTFVIVRMMLWISGRSPLRMVHSWETAREIEILRQEGAAYQFRHDEIRMRLVEAPGSASRE